jgi:hypothetical protein
MTKLETERSYAPLTDAHLGRLSMIADGDHHHFTLRALQAGQSMQNVVSAWRSRKELRFIGWTARPA